MTDVEREEDAGGHRSEAAVPEAVAEYKRILKSVLDMRPSGFRQKLASAIGRNPSFVSQITNPSYAVPIPAPHIDTIMEVCHLSAEQRAAFMAAYARAHPRKVRQLPSPARRPGRRLTLTVPDFGNDQANWQFDTAVEEFMRRLSQLMGGPE